MGQAGAVAAACSFLFYFILFFTGVLRIKKKESGTDSVTTPHLHGPEFRAFTALHRRWLFILCLWYLFYCGITMYCAKPVDNIMLSSLLRCLRLCVCLYPVARLGKF